MMNYEQAKAYGKKIGCKYYLYNSNGGLMGGSKTREGIEEMKARFEEDFKTNPWRKGMTLEIREA